MEKFPDEATESEVERVYGFLMSNYLDNSSSPIPYFEFVVDPESFARTVENIYHASFLIRDGLARMDLNADGLPCISPVSKEEANALKGLSNDMAQMDVGGEPTACSLVDDQDYAASTSSGHAAIISMNMQKWREVIEVFDIKRAMIPPMSIEG